MAESATVQLHDLHHLAVPRTGESEPAHATERGKVPENSYFS